MGAWPRHRVRSMARAADANDRTTNRAESRLIRILLCTGALCLVIGGVGIVATERAATAALHQGENRQPMVAGEREFGRPSWGCRAPTAASTAILAACSPPTRPSVRVHDGRRMTCQGMRSREGRLTRFQKSSLIPRSRRFYAAHVEGQIADLLAAFSVPTDMRDRLLDAWRRARPAKATTDAKRGDPATASEAAGGLLGGRAGPRRVSGSEGCVDRSVGGAAGRRGRRHRARPEAGGVPDQGIIDRMGPRFHAVVFAPAIAAARTRGERSETIRDVIRAGWTPSQPSS